MAENKFLKETWQERKKRIRHRWAKPFIWFEWLMERFVNRLHSWAFIDFLDLVARFSIIFAVIFYFAESGDRKKQKHFQAWQLINSVGKGGAKEALEELNRDQVLLAGINLKNCYLERIRLPGAYLWKANLAGAYLSRANLEGTRLWKASLAGAYLSGASLEGANLIEANLLGANLTGANLEGANLAEANLERAYLSFANLRGVNLWRANLAGANLSRTDLGKAILKETKYLTIEQLSQVKTLYKAQLDPKLMDQVKKKYPHLLEKPKDEG